MRVETLTSPEQAIVDSVSSERLMADTEAIAQWVRLSGTEEERKAFDHAERVLKELGLETKLYLAPAYVSLPEAADLRLEGAELPAITHSMSASTPPEGLRLPLVYVGAGRETEYAAHDVAGKIALVDGIAMPSKVLAAERHGAAAAIFANRDEHVHEMIVSRVWGSPTPETRGLLPHIPVASVGDAAGERLRAALDRGPVEVELAARARTGWWDIPTLVAELRAGERPEDFLLLSGHIDSWHYGAMDNASANAAMLETVRVLLGHRNRFRRSLRLAFWSGHSHARYAGSAWYADAFWEDLHEHCVLHLNVDSVGAIGATVLSQAHAMPEARACAATAIAAVTGEEFEGTRFGRAGDQSFLGHGVPSLFMSLSEQPPMEGDAASGFAELVGGEGAKSGGLGWWWHTTEDTLDKIDPDFLVRDTRIYALVAYRFLAEPLLPLDVEAAAADVLAHLERWQERAGRRFDLSAVIERAREAVRLAGELNARRESLGDEVEPEGAERLNAATLGAGRALVRVNYTRSEPFDHDPALSQPPVPLLAPIDELVATERGGDREHELRTLLVRRRNRVAHELAQACRALRDALAV